MEEEAYISSSSSPPTRDANSEAKAPEMLQSNAATSELRAFHIFPDLPAEIRAQIWHAAIVPHIVRWIRTDNEGDGASNLFTCSSRALPLFSVCQESRETTLFYGKYKLLSTSPKPVWFSAAIDYLFLDPGWEALRAPPHGKDPLDSLPFDFKDVRRIMVHPNYTDHRLRPGVPLERMSLLERILVVADEKSIGIQSKFMLASVYDLKRYFEGVKSRNPGTKIPYIAVACLGWVGEERGKFHHGDEDGRQLVAVFEGYAEMKEHLNAMREEEVKFLKERFSHRKPGLTLHFRSGQKIDSLPAESLLGTSTSQNSNDSQNVPDLSLTASDPSPAPEEPPSYAQAVSGEDV